MKRLFLLLIFTHATLFAQHSDNEINKSMQVKWIKNALKELKITTQTVDFKISKPQINSEPDYKRILYTIEENSKMVCGSGEWIYFRTHSKHDNKEIGDITLAVSDKGLQYVYYGHVCGGEVYFKNNSDTVPDDAPEFFAKFTSDAQNWILWK